jgi:integrase
MSRRFKSDKAIEAMVRTGGRFSFGDSIMLNARGKNSALWVFKYRHPQTKVFNSVSLGSWPQVTEEQAYIKRNRFWNELKGSTAIVPVNGNGLTFAEALKLFVDVRSQAWGPRSTEAAAYDRVAAAFGSLPLASIDAPQVAAALRHWHGTPTAGKHLSRAKAVIDFAIANGWFTRANPATMSIAGKLLPAVATVEHHDAMAAADVPAFMKTLASFDTPASRALRWTILTAARAGETLGATWGEIEDNIWSLPGERMKARKAHVVPLTPEALALLGPRGEPDALLFGRLDERAMRGYAKGRGSVHGFRSTFADWAGEAGHDATLIELSLAHAIGSTVTRAYTRSNLLERRRELMAAWASFVAGKPRPRRK